MSYFFIYGHPGKFCLGVLSLLLLSSPGCVHDRVKTLLGFDRKLEDPHIGFIRVASRHLHDLKLYNACVDCIDWDIEYAMSYHGDDPVK